MDMTDKFEQQAKRLIKISKTKPLIPDEFIPWDIKPTDGTLYMPEELVSLYGTEIWDKLTFRQQQELGRLEMAQVMYSYAWSEGLACHFFNQHLLTLEPTSVEYKFLIREIIEEMRHQEMFGRAIEVLGVRPIKPIGIYNEVASLAIRYASPPVLFMSVLSIELMADIYAKHIRRDEKVYKVLRKVSELHQIEEGRHIFYTELWLNRVTQNAGYFKSSLYSLTMLFSIFFLKGLYIQRQFYKQIGLAQVDTVYKLAKKQYKKNFVEFALPEVVSFVKSFNGFNQITRPLWKLFLGLKV